MSLIFLILTLLLAFLITLLVIPSWIKKAEVIGLMWENMNSIKREKIAGSGGIIVVLGFLIGVTSFIAYQVFYEHTQTNLIQIFALMIVIILLAGIGLVDDLLGWRRGGLRKRTRLVLVALSTIPLISINAGRSIISAPFFGQIDLGLIYPLIIIPLGIVGASATYNFLAGFNGLEAGQGIIFLSGISLVSYFTGNYWVSIICLCMIAPLLAFLLYNYYPAKILPGDSLTYSVGGLIAIASILGNFERIAVFFFIPYILEVILKSRGGLVKQSFGKPEKDNSLGLVYEKFYSLNHISIYLLKKMNIKSTEKRAVYLIWAFQILIIILGFIIFKEGIFS